MTTAQADAGWPACKLPNGARDLSGRTNWLGGVENGIQKHGCIVGHSCGGLLTALTATIKVETLASHPSEQEPAHAVTSSGCAA